MIHRHDFNSDWWGQPVGLVRDPAFFSLPSVERSLLLKPYVWVEWQDDADQVPPATLQAAGFFWADAQIPFQVPLRLSPELQEIAADVQVQVLPPGQSSLCARDIRPFEHERFHALPGSSPERVTARFAMWSQLLRNSDPDLALEIRLHDQVQGWYFAQKTEKSLLLTLAMLHRDSRISGLHLYAAAIQYYTRFACRYGQAAFSVRNTAVLNMYSHLGARFKTPKHCFFWTA
jgi:hypothetical protein